FHEVGNLVGGEIIEHEGRREDEPPGIRQRSTGRARAPAARLVAYRNTLDRNPEDRGVPAARGFEVASRLALEEVGDPAADMGRRARHAKEPRPVRAGLRPDGAARARPVRDAVLLAAYWNVNSVGEGLCVRQTLEPRRDPAAVSLREVVRLSHAAAP